MMKITHIDVILEDVDGPVEARRRTTLTRDETFTWSVGGDAKLFPRHMKFMTELNELARDLDK